MPRVLVIHRQPAEAAARAARLSAEGFEAEAYPVLGVSGVRSISANPPDAILIDLTELPSYGRYMGALLRERKSTRAIPLIFLEGDPEKSKLVRDLIPGARIATLSGLGPAIEQAIRTAPAEPPPVRPPSVPACRKLRIDENTVVALVGAPANIRTILAPIPKGVRFQKTIGDAGIVMYFLKSAAAYGKELASIGQKIRPSRIIWICWPKRTSATPCDLSPERIRSMAIPYGMIDSKICSIDGTWSGMALSRRRGAKAGRPRE